MVPLLVASLKWLLSFSDFLPALDRFQNLMHTLRTLDMTKTKMQVMLYMAHTARQDCHPTQETTAVLMWRHTSKSWLRCWASPACLHTSCITPQTEPSLTHSASMCIAQDERARWTWWRTGVQGAGEGRWSRWSQARLKDEL